jgi:hypothetical protein
MDNIKIEKNIKIPAMYGRYSKYPFGEMKVGDSFLIERADELGNLRQAASHWARRNGGKAKFSIRKWEKAFRCWRVQ